MRLLGAASALLDRVGDTTRAGSGADFDRLVAATGSALDKDEWDAAWAAGRALTMEQAVDYALS